MTLGKSGDERLLTDREQLECPRSFDAITTQSRTGLVQVSPPFNYQPKFYKNFTYIRTKTLAKTTPTSLTLQFE